MIRIRTSDSWRDKLERLKEFLEWWHSITLAVDLETKTHWEKMRLPAVLKTFHSWAGDSLHVLSPINRLHRLDRIDCRGERVRFFSECEGVCHWYCANDEDDPVVWRMDVDARPDRKGILGILRKTRREDVWRTEEERLAGFLWQVCIQGAILGAAYCYVGRPEESWLKQIRATCVKLDLLPMGWPEYPVELFYGDAALMMIYPAGAQFEVVCGAREVVDFGSLQRMIEDQFERMS